VVVVVVVQVGQAVLQHASSWQLQQLWGLGEQEQQQQQVVGVVARTGGRVAVGQDPSSRSRPLASRRLDQGTWSLRHLAG
jgi:hypothetical protein